MREELRREIELLTGERRRWRPTAGPADGRSDPVAVSSASLGALLDLWRSDLVARVGAGCTLAALERQLAPHGLTLGIDAPCPERSTLGGIFARAECGTSAQPNQSLRERVLGLTAIDGNGRVLKAGARVVKNVAGYDLARLHHGARGSFGMLLDFTLRLSARPRTIAHWSLPCAAEELESALRNLRRPIADRDPDRLLWLNRQALDRLGIDEAGMVVAECRGDDAAPFEGARRFERYDAVRDFALDGPSLRLALPPRALLQHMSRISEQAVALRADLLGGAHVIAAPVELPLSELAEHARAQGGWLVPRELSFVGELRQPTPVARRLKAAFDPHDLLPALRGALA